MALTRNDIIVKKLRDYIKDWNKADGDQVYEYDIEQVKKFLERLVENR